MTEEIAVFIDWQNVYKAARKAFGRETFGYIEDPEDDDVEPYPNAYGNFSPYQLALKLAAGNDRGSSGKLVRVEIHRGLPSSSRDPDGFSANRKQSRAWMNEDEDVVFPKLRPLRYSKDGTPQEKGVDVNLAIGAVESVLTQACDVAVLFSHDTDLLPAAEAIARISSASQVETAAWTSSDFDQRLRPKVPGVVYHHHLDRAGFDSVETRINYSRS